MNQLVSHAHKVGKKNYVGQLDRELRPHGSGTAAYENGNKYEG